MYVSNKFTIAVAILFVVSGLLFFLDFSQHHFSRDTSRARRLEDGSRTVFQVPLSKEEVPLDLPRDEIEMTDISTRQIIGGVVPHHLLASDFLSEFFSLLSHRSNRPKTIVLLSPNHFEVGERNVQTVDVLWRTPYGDVETDIDVLRALRAVTNEEDAIQSFEKEHGIYNIVPYIAHFLPETKIVPVILRYRTTSEEIGALVKFLKPLVDREEVFVIGSVDFSHYLSKSESDRKDIETLRAMKGYDLSRIARFGSDHLDSPATILTLLQLAHETGSGEIRVLRHDNSADDTRGSHDSTTSHFSFFLVGPSKE